MLKSFQCRASNLLCSLYDIEYYRNDYSSKFCPDLTVTNLIEIMPIIGTVFFLISIFAQNEQKTRLFSLFNAVIYLVYMGIVGSTTILSQIFSIVTTITAIYKYRNTKGRND